MASYIAKVYPKLERLLISLSNSLLSKQSKPKQWCLSVMLYYLERGRTNTIWYATKVVVFDPSIALTAAFNRNVAKNHVRGLYSIHRLTTDCV